MHRSLGTHAPRCNAPARCAAVALAFWRALLMAIVSAEYDLKACEPANADVLPYAWFRPGCSPSWQDAVNADARVVPVNERRALAAHAREFRARLRHQAFDLTDAEAEGTALVVAFFEQMEVMAHEEMASSDSMVGETLVLLVQWALPWVLMACAACGGAWFLLAARLRSAAHCGPPELGVPRGVFARLLPPRGVRLCTARWCTAALSRTAAVSRAAAAGGTRAPAAAEPVARAPPSAAARPRKPPPPRKPGKRARRAAAAQAAKDALSAHDAPLTGSASEAAEMATVAAPAAAGSSEEAEDARKKAGGEKDEAPRHTHGKAAYPAVQRSDAALEVAEIGTQPSVSSAAEPADAAEAAREAAVAEPLASPAAPLSPAASCEGVARSPALPHSARVEQPQVLEALGQRDALAATSKVTAQAPRSPQPQPPVVVPIGSRPQPYSRVLQKAGTTPAAPLMQAALGVPQRPRPCGRAESPAKATEVAPAEASASKVMPDKDAAPAGSASGHRPCGEPAALVASLAGLAHVDDVVGPPAAPPVASSAAVAAALAGPPSRPPAQSDASATAVAATKQVCSARVVPCTRRVKRAPLCSGAHGAAFSV